MENPRIYGKSPYRIAVVHGGPGAAGEMAPVARELACDGGVIEPFQTAGSVQGQVEELASLLEKFGTVPLILVGFSWGAWLSVFVAGQYPTLVAKLILISSGSFEEKYAARVQYTRLKRFNKKEKAEVESLLEEMDNPAVKNRNEIFARFGALCTKVDTFDPIDAEQKQVQFREDIYRSVWKEADALRRDGALMNAAKKLTCPVTAIHGDHDPHPAEGVRTPLSAVLKDFRFILLKCCGHKPWIERQAREEFYRVLKEEVKIQNG